MEKHRQSGCLIEGILEITPVPSNDSKNPSESQDEETGKARISKARVLMYFRLQY